MEALKFGVMVRAGKHFEKIRSETARVSGVIFDRVAHDIKHRWQILTGPMVMSPGEAKLRNLLKIPLEDEITKPVRVKPLEWSDQLRADMAALGYQPETEMEPVYPVGKMNELPGLFGSRAGLVPNYSADIVIYQISPGKLL